MLAAAQPPAQGSKDAFAARGRSRQVAGTALARQASEERSRICERMGLSSAPAGTSIRASHESSQHQAHSTNAIAGSSKLAESSSTKISSAGGQRRSTRSKADSKDRKTSRRRGASSHIFVSSSCTSLSSLDDDTHSSLRIAAPVPVKAHNPPVKFLSNSYQLSPPCSPSSSISMSMSPESYDAPPSPRSLEDQVHYAYAADDIHLAKILLLRLKGIEVTSDDDPRIAAVQDEDFDFCFVPNGRVFVNEAQERQLEEIRRKELQQLEERKRNERLRHCEIKWFEEKQRLRQEKILVMQRKERKRLQEEERIRRAEEAERLRKEREEEELEKKRALETEAARRRAFRSGRRPRTPRHRSSHTPSSERHPASQEEATFVYDFPTITPIAPKSSTLTPSASSSSLSSLASTQQIRNSLDTYNAYSRNPYNPRLTKQQQPRLAGATFDDSSAVSFGDVLRSMQGPLFPSTVDDTQPMASTSSSSSSLLSSPSSQCTSPGCPNSDLSNRQRLLEALLEEVSLDLDERRTRSSKGKEPEVKPRRRPSCTLCSAPGSPLGHGANVKTSASLSSIASTSSTSSSASSSSLSSASSSTSLRRTSSWLSFRGVSASSLYTSGSWKSASSSATDLTVPSPSPSPKPISNQWFVGSAGRAKSTTSVPTISNDIITTFIKPTDPRSPPSSTPLRVPLRHPSCLNCGLRFERIAITDGPLGEPEVDTAGPPVRQTPYAHQSTLSRSSSLRSLRRADQEEKQNILSRVARFVEMARSFQNAYAGLAAGAALDASREGQVVKAKAVTAKDMAICRGDRARPKDVLAFTAPLDPVAEADVAAALAASEIDGVALITGITPCPELDSEEEEDWTTPVRSPRAPEYIPLPPMPRAPADPDAPFPMTVLPNPLPYKTHFKPVLSPSRSPFRFHAFHELHTVYPSQASSPAHSLALRPAGGLPRLVTWRIRSVANPMFLRMRACQNILRADGQGADQEMEGLMARQRQRAQQARQSPPQGVNPNALFLATVGGGRERVTGIAYEGLGDTTLKNTVAVSTISRRGTPIVCS